MRVWRDIFFALYLIVWSLPYNITHLKATVVVI